MLRRTLLTFVNLAMIGVAIGVQRAAPQYASIAFYLLLGWIFGSLALMYGPWSARPVRLGPARPSLGPTGTSLPSGPGAPDLGFCVFCAAPLAPGAGVCPSCGHVVAPI